MHASCISYCSYFKPGQIIGGTGDRGIDLKGVTLFIGYKMIGIESPRPWQTPFLSGNVVSHGGETKITPDVKKKSGYFRYEF